MEKVYILNLIPAYFQLFFLPGFIYLFYNKFKTNFFSLITISFCISLVINYLLIFILILFNLYTTLSLWFFLFLELLILFINKDNIKVYLLEIKKISFLEYNNFEKDSIFFIAVFIGIGLIAEPLYSIIKNDKEGFLQVFNLGDVLAYTSKWAREWYNSAIPETSFFRPQLWSANISLVYKFFGNEYFEFFGKQIFNLVFVYFIFAIIGICFTTNNLIYFFGTIIGIYYSLGGTFTQGYSGYMEIPLSLTFIFFLSFAYEIKFRKVNATQIVYISPLIISSIFLTKELGWIFGLAILLYFYNFEKLSCLRNKFSIKNFIKISSIICLIFLPFYIYTFFNYDIFNFKNPVFKLLLFDTDTHLSAGHGERYLELSTRLIDGIDKTPDFLILPLLINVLFFICKDKLISYVISPFILVYYVIWLLLMSNEFRYLYPIIVISWFSSFFIAFEIIKQINKNNIFRKFFIFFFILLFFVTILTNKKIPNKSVILNKVDEKKLLSLASSKEQILITNLLDNYDGRKSKAITNIYPLYDLAFAKLKNLKITYSDNLEKNNKEFFSYIVLKEKCINFNKQKYKKIFFDKEIGCILILVD